MHVHRTAGLALVASGLVVLFGKLVMVFLESEGGIENTFVLEPPDNKGFKPEY